jgi:hypothetical protein
MDTDTPKDFTEVAKMFFRHLYDDYITGIYSEVQRCPDLLKIVAGFLLAPTKVIIYLGKTHIVVEYEGSERLSVLPKNVGSIEIKIIDYADCGLDLFDEIIGFTFDDTTSGFRVPLLALQEDLILPTNRGISRMIDLGWNLTAQDHFLPLNAGGLTLREGEFARLVNGFFFDANEKGLITRHIKWADCFPIQREDLGDTWHIGFRIDQFKAMAQADATYYYYLPEDYRLKKLPRINRFIEFYSTPERTEPEITSFLAQPDFHFLLTMRFGCVNLIVQPTLEWQSESRDAIKPDFILVQPGDYGDICEFKLPHLKTGGIVGRHNRASFSAEINSYVAQTRVYKEYFEDPNNRNWVENKFGIKVHNPARYLIAGTRSDMKSDEWKGIESDYRDLRILNYNDLVDGVVAQFYR